MGDATKLLHLWRQGDAGARDQLVELIHGDLYSRAARLLAQRGPRQPLQATELVNESFLKLAGGASATYENRQHFLATAAVAMRNVLSDYYRQAKSQKRGVEAVTLATHHLAMSTTEVTFDALDTALSQLQEVHPPLAELVSLKFFSGMTHAEIAAHLGHSESTVKRQWRAAKAWLADALSGNKG